MYRPASDRLGVVRGLTASSMTTRTICTAETTTSSDTLPLIAIGRLYRCWLHAQCSFSSSQYDLAVDMKQHAGAELQNRQQRGVCQHLHMCIPSPERLDMHFAISQQRRKEHFIICESHRKADVEAIRFHGVPSRIRSLSKHRSGIKNTDAVALPRRVHRRQKMLTETAESMFDVARC